MKLIILVGNVGCGKSTKALELAKEGYVIINDDAIVTMIGGGDYSLYDKNKEPIYKILETVGIYTALDYNFNVVVNKPSMSRKKREKHIRLGKQRDAEIIAYDWGQGIKDDLYRRLLDPKGYNKWTKVFCKKFNEYETPTLDEGFDQIIRMR